MSEELNIIEKKDGFVLIKVSTERGEYKFWIIPTEDGNKLCFEIDASVKSKGEITLTQTR
jgi:hypothetical protein